jgi:hypothetical protein
MTHKTVLFGIVAVVFCAGCAANAQSVTPPKGFASLFNGKDLAGWKGLVADPPARAKMSAQELADAQAKADELMRKNWRITNGEMVYDGNGYDNICTVRDYGDFELLIDWKIDPHADSGIYLRGSPQVQIWDQNNRSGTGSGGLFNNKVGDSKPSLVADKPVGEWNTFRIIMTGEKVTVYLNDKLVVDNVVLENYWQRDIPIYSKGQIELQAHTTRIYFKNIFIREIEKKD